MHHQPANYQRNMSGLATSAANTKKINLTITLKRLKKNMKKSFLFYFWKKKKKWQKEKLIQQHHNNNLFSPLRNNLFKSTLERYEMENLWSLPRYCWVALLGYSSDQMFMSIGLAATTVRVFFCIFL